MPDAIKIKRKIDELETATQKLNSAYQARIAELEAEVELTKDSLSAANTQTARLLIQRQDLTAERDALREALEKVLGLETQSVVTERDYTRYKMVVDAARALLEEE